MWNNADQNVYILFAWPNIIYKGALLPIAYDVRAAPVPLTDDSLLPGFWNRAFGTDSDEMVARV